MTLRRITNKKKHRLLECLLLAALIAFTNAAPQPDADPEPEAEAEADAEADAQYGPPVIMPNPFSPDVAPEGNPGGIDQDIRPSPCGAIATQCYGYGNCNLPQPAPQPIPQQRCFPQWKYECSGGQQDRVRGITRVKKVCTTIRAKDCRIIPDIIERSIQTERCFSKPLRQTFTYTRKICQLAPTQKQRPETWLNEKLHKVGQDMKEHCVNVKTFNCRDSVRNVTRTVQVPVQKKIPMTRMKCRQVYVPGRPTPPQRKTITRTRYRRVCNDIQVEPKCSTGSCIIGGGACPQNQAVCSRNEFNFVSSCPLQNGGAQPQTITRNKREAEADPQMIQPLGPGGMGPIGPLGPGGMQPIQPLGPGGMQPIQPLGPGGFPPIQPLGPGGMQPIQPLGPGGIQPMPPIQPLGPGGIQPIQPLGPGGIQPIQPLGPGGTRCPLIRQPICSQNSGGACISGMQQCCEQQTQTRRQCRRVPYQVQEEVMIPGRPGQAGYKQVCANVTEFRTQTDYKTVQKVEIVNDKKCDPEFKRVCHNLTIPKYEVTKETRKEMITFVVNSCRPRVVVQKYVHTFPDGDVECRPEMVKRRFRINRVKCDLEKDRQYCFPIPYTEMEKIPGGPRCEWVQKQVCQDAPITPSSCQNPPNRNCAPCDMERQQNGAFDPNNGIYVPGGMYDDGGAFDGGDGGMFGGGIEPLPQDITPSGPIVVDPKRPVPILGPNGFKIINPIGPQPLGPGGMQPIAPLGPGGIQPIAPLGPGGIQPMAPLGPGGIQPMQPLGPGGMQPINPLYNQGGQGMFQSNLNEDNAEDDLSSFAEEKLDDKMENLLSR